MGEGGLLLDIADCIGMIYHNLTAVALLTAEENSHQRRLARAVCTDEPYLVPAHNLKVHM